jgi:hypothetical protein
MSVAVRGYEVRLLDGPAQGWAYLTLIAPDEVIAVAPRPGTDDWFRTLLDAAPWPGQCRYHREPLPHAPLTDDQVTSDDDILVTYRLETP